MFGHSYLAFTQWIIADQLPQEVKTLYMTAFGTERYRQMYNNGMFRPDIYTLWTMSNAGVPPIVEDPYWKALWVRPHVEMDKEIFGVELPWYREWVTTVSPESDFWKNGMWAELQRIPEKVDIPVFLAVGWYDHHLEGMIYAYNNLPKSEDLTINGNIKVNLSLSSDAEDTAFTIKVMEVFPNGETYNIRNGIRSLAFKYCRHMGSSKGRKDCPPNHLYG